MKLKPRQQEAFDAVFAALDRGVDRQLIHLPTGVGKTVLGCHIAARFDRVLFLAHRQELVAQTAGTMTRVDPAREVGFIMQGQHSIAPFTVGMIPSVHRRLERIDPDAFDLVVIDECHHACSKTYRAVADHFNHRLRLGLSATPERMDGSDLSHLFTEITYSMSVGDAVAEGLLVKPVARQCLTSCSLDRVRTVAGDLNEGDLAVAVDVPERNRFIVEKYREHAQYRRAIAFTVNIAHATHLAAAFNEAGVVADWIAGDSPDRAEKLARFARGEIQVLASCMVLTEGFDDCGISAVLLCRPTKSRPLFAQMIGRGLRLAEGKADCVVLDFVDVAGQHSLASAWRFLGHTQPPGSDEPQGMANPQDRVARVAAVDLERQIDLLLPPPELPTFTGRWQYEPATEKQLAFLARLGYDMEADYSKGGAAQIISGHPASSHLLRRLQDLGYDVSVPWTYGQAQKAFDASKANLEAALVKMRQAGFRVEAKGRLLRVSPSERLTPIQAHWVERHSAGLVWALRG